MSYGIEIQGGREGASVEQAKTIEREEMAKARQLVQRLANVSEARFVGEYIGEIDLLSPATPIRIKA